jgi:hypothetical protein
MCSFTERFSNRSDEAFFPVNCIVDQDWGLHHDHENECRYKRPEQPSGSIFQLITRIVRERIYDCRDDTLSERLCHECQGVA